MQTKGLEFQHSNPPIPNNLTWNQVNQWTEASFSCLQPFWLWVGWFWEGAVRPSPCSAPALSPQQLQPPGGPRNNPPQTWTPWGKHYNYTDSSHDKRPKQQYSPLLVVFQWLVEVVQLNRRHRADHQGVESRQSEFCRQSRSEHILLQALWKLTFGRAQRVQEHLEISGEQKTRLNEEMWNRDTASVLTQIDTHLTEEEQRWLIFFMVWLSKDWVSPCLLVRDSFRSVISL